MLGNSSSGLIEAGLFGLPTINVGGRQAGRERGPNVLDVENCVEMISAALARLGEVPKRAASYSPYGDGCAAPRIAQTLNAFAFDRRLLNKRLVA